MARYKKIKLNMRQDNIDKLLFSYLSGYAPSRASVAETCSVSKMTSGKVASALLESGFMVERVFSLDGSRPCAHLFCRASANILVIDMSSSVFKMSIANAYGEIKFQEEYEYDTSLFPDENLNIFLSRCGFAAIKSNRAFCSITVIYADESSDRNFGAILPPISDKERITLAVYEIFNKRPMAHMTVSDAISSAMSFKAHGDISNGISYIFVGDHLSLFHIHQNGSVTICNPRAVLNDSEKHFILYNDFITKDEADLIFVRLCSFMGAAFSPSAILLESDAFKPDIYTCEKIIRKFALSGQNAPTVFTKDNEHPLCLIGAVRNTMLKIFKRYITSY